MFRLKNCLPTTPMNSPPSRFDLPPDVFGLLHPAVQRWIRQKGWTSLRDIQAQAIDVLLRGTGDLLIAAATASGKTEAAFLPILSSLAQSPREGIRALYVGPLKALINDQFLRLEELCEALELPVVKWHGDAPAAAKQKLMARPRGIVLITPESLEAMFIRRPERLRALFTNLDFIVIDEVHAFLGAERGVQLASLLKRLDALVGDRPRRVGLSATIGDLALAAEWLRPGTAQSVKIIESRAQASPLQLQVRAVIEPNETDAGDLEGATAPNENSTVLRQIANHLFKVLRGKGNHLVFAGSRRRTEALSDLLRTMCDEAGVPNEFFPHHGNLSRETREDVESRLKAGTLPTTAIATTTLELGIDIGAVETVAQIGAPASISSLRQRLGRSGRREGTPSVLRIYASEHALDSRSSLFDQLRSETVQCVAAVQLLLRRWVEPPAAGAYHLSTLLHQTLSVICEKGGVKPTDAYNVLGGGGPFEAVTPTLYAALLHAMHDRDDKLIEQGPDGTLMLGQLGERLTGRYDFYAVFSSADEYTIATANKVLGTLSVSNALGPGDFVVFAGRRWKVASVDDTAKRVLVEPAPAGRLPLFEGEAAALSDELLQEMRKVFLADDIPVYLDATAKSCLAEGRAAFRRLGLDRSCAVLADGRTHLFPWVGTRKLDTLRLALRYCGFKVEQGRIALSIATKPEPPSLAAAISELAASFPPPQALAMMSEKLRNAKYDYLLPDSLLRTTFAQDVLDVEGTVALCRALSRGGTSQD